MQSARWGSAALVFSFVWKGEVSEIVADALKLYWSQGPGKDPVMSPVNACVQQISSSHWPGLGTDNRLPGLSDVVLRRFDTSAWADRETPPDARMSLVQVRWDEQQQSHCSTQELLGNTLWPREGAQPGPATNALLIRSKPLPRAQQSPWHPALTLSSVH